MPWRTVANENDKPKVEFELENVVRGFFRPDLFLDYVRYFILFEDDGGGLIKKIADYHQFHGVQEAVRVTMIAANPVEDGTLQEDRAAYGKEVVAHAGEREEYLDVLLRGMLLQQPEMNNPTLVVVTDRNDLDGQLFQQFCSAKDLLKQEPEQPEQADSREELRTILAARESGGIISTTVQHGRRHAQIAGE